MKVSLENQLRIPWMVDSPAGHVWLPAGLHFFGAIENPPFCSMIFQAINLHLVRGFPTFSHNFPIKTHLFFRIYLKCLNVFPCFPMIFPSKPPCVQFFWGGLWWFLDPGEPPRLAPVLPKNDGVTAVIAVPHALKARRLAARRGCW